MRSLGDGGFATTAQLSGTSYSNALAIADLNRDGKLDLAYAVVRGSFPDFDLVLATGKGDGTFTLLAPIRLRPWATGIVVGDFNADGAPDVAVLNINDPAGAQLFLQK